jgi:hypothetical protein
VLVVLPSQDTRVGLPKAVMPGMALALRHRGHVFSPAAARHHSNMSFPNTHVVARYNERVTRTVSARSSYVSIVFISFSNGPARRMNEGSDYLLWCYEF